MSSVPGALEIVSCSARLSREIAANVSAIVVNRRAFVFDTGATTRAASSSSEKKPWMSVFGSARFAMTEVRRSSSSGSLPDRLVEVGAAAVEGVAEADEVVARRLARRRVEHPEHLVELDGDPRLALRERRAVGERPARDPAVELDVLQAERRARPDGHVRVGRDGAELAVELQRQLRADLAAGQRDRLHPGDDADAEAAGADLVAGDEVRAVGEVDLELRRRHERQARVRVVREEDGDDDHEHRHGADEHRARDDGGAVAADRAHGLSR